MIPTMLLLGFVSGLLLARRWAWWSIPVLGIVWGVLVATQPQPHVGVWLAAVGAVPLGLLNAAVGVLVGRGLQVGVRYLADRLLPSE